MIRVSDYIANFIYEQGVKDVFMLSGGGSIYLNDGIACHGKLNHIDVHHEATAPMMAEAYARLNGNLGVVYVTTGPGGTNAISGLVEAWVDSSPILIISGQVLKEYTTYNSNLDKFRTFGTQELNIIKIVKSITKYSKMVNNPYDIRYHLEKAVHFAKANRPGPVWLDIPLDVQSAYVDETKLRGYLSNYKVQLSNELLDITIRLIFKMLSESKKPLIIAGNGVRLSKCKFKFKKLIETLNIPVVFSRLGQDILSYSHNNNFGHAGINGNKLSNNIISESDLIIVLGSRLSVPFIQPNEEVFAGKTKIIVIDIDRAELNKHTINKYMSIHADVKDIVNCMLTNIYNYNINNYDDWMSQCTNYKNRYNIITKDLERNPIDLYYFVSRLDALSNEKHIFVSDAGSSYYVTGQVLKFEHSQREITSGAFASMGLSLPLAIGCAIADRNKQILAVTGDGSIELNIQELKTMSDYNLDIKLFVINNGGYVSIRNAQDMLCNSRYINSENSVMNFEKLADTFNLKYVTIEDYAHVDNILINLINEHGPVLIEVMCDNKQKILQ